MVSNGPFANRALAILRSHHCDVIEVMAEWGQAVDPQQVRETLGQHPAAAGVMVVANETGAGVRNPVRELAQVAHERELPIVVDAVSALAGYDLPVDEWELDLVCTSSNKSLEIPPGLGIISVSERAWACIDARPDEARRGWYYNLATWKPFRSTTPGARVAPATVATSLVVALRAQPQTDPRRGDAARPLGALCLGAAGHAVRVERAGLPHVGRGRRRIADRHSLLEATGHGQRAGASELYDPTARLHVGRWIG
ncbi:MAG: alanine--glyoxylate aminotransferase family protein [Caldilineaceae bacterium]|nr:alanine--glyoxylate aminotransferase family protein [Caldilineaceae bacterium]